jgi:RNA polymerase sigma-70 factor (ECF subfamily)
VNFIENQDEHILITAAKQGNRKAFDVLYVRYRKVIADLVYRYLGNYHESEELLQEIFIQCFLNLDKFRIRSGATFFSWLYRIGINMSINYLKRRKSRSEMIDRQSYVLSEEGTSNNPEKYTLRKKFEHDFYLGLSRLSPNQRMIFILKHFQDMRICEIAQLMQCTEGTIRKQFYRGVTKLRKEMSAYMGEKNEM